MAVTYGDIQDAAAISNALAFIFDTGHEAAQWNRWTDTLRWFQPRKLPMQGDRLYFYAYTGPYEGVRRTKSKEAEFPRAFDFDHTQCFIAWTDLTEFQASPSFTGLAERKSRDKKSAVYKTAVRLAREVGEAFSANVNRAFHQNTDCVIGIINGAPLDEDGTTYTGGQTDAYLIIDNGSISQFCDGMVLDIREGADGTDVQVTVVVNDVYHTSDGPGSASGPGIVVTIDGSNSGDSDLDNLADNDEITLSGEVDSANFWSLEDWWDSSVSVLGLTRTAKGLKWATPYQKDGGSNAIDFDDDIRPAALTMARIAKVGRRVRRSQGLTITESFLALSTPEINDEALQAINDRQRTTTVIASTMDEAERKRLFGWVGYDGVVWIHPDLGHVYLQCDPVATPNKIRFLEPNSWFLVTGHNNNTLEPSFIDNNGTPWHTARGDNGRLINQKIAGAYVRMTLVTDQPRANYAVTGVTGGVTV